LAICDRIGGRVTFEAFERRLVEALPQIIHQRMRGRAA
jgi:hypothetical protein